MYGRKLKIPLPKNKTELALLTKWYFGTELHLSDLWVDSTGGRYSVKETYSSYNNLEEFFFTSYCIKGYDYSARFWGTVFGHLTCGGIAEHSYGQFDIKSHRHKKRLRELQSSLRRKGPDPVRKSFVRLAAQPRGRRDWN